jgi:hypothetical protein
LVNHFAGYRLRAALTKKRAWAALSALIAIVLLKSFWPGREKMLVLSTMASTKASETHAALALFSQTYASEIVFSGRVATLRQLRQGDRPNSWECAWIVWNYRDNEHFYYLALKPDGWELGKRDPAYEGGQRFMATGSRAFPVGAWTSFTVSQRDNHIVVSADGDELASLTDATPPIYTSGKIGLYNEDAVVALARLTSPVKEDFRAHAEGRTTADGSNLRDWTFPFLGFGAASIEPVSFKD